MNRTNIEWADYTCNDMYHGCRNPCVYCYARRLAFGRLRGRYGYPKDDPFQPLFFPEGLDAPKRIKKPSKIFIGSMGELWGPWFDYHVQNQVLFAIEHAHWHTFLMLTKNPEGVVEWQKTPPGPPPGVWKLPKNLWLGVSVDTTEGLKRLELLGQVKHANKFVSFEPLLEDVADRIGFEKVMRDSGVRWVIIGAQTGAGAPDPKYTALKALKVMNACRRLQLPIFMKANLGWANPPQEFPEGFP